MPRGQLGRVLRLLLAAELGVRPGLEPLRLQRELLRRELLVHAVRRGVFQGRRTRPVRVRSGHLLLAREPVLLPGEPGHGVRQLPAVPDRIDGRALRKPVHVPRPADGDERRRERLRLHGQRIQQLRDVRGLPTEQLPDPGGRHLRLRGGEHLLRRGLCFLLVPERLRALQLSVHLMPRGFSQSDRMPVQRQLHLPERPVRTGCRLRLVPVLAAKVPGHGFGQGQRRVRVPPSVPGLRRGPEPVRVPAELRLGRDRLRSMPSGFLQALSDSVPVPRHRPELRRRRLLVRGRILPPVPAVRPVSSRRHLEPHELHVRLGRDGLQCHRERLRLSAQLHDVQQRVQGVSGRERQNRRPGQLRLLRPEHGLRLRPVRVRVRRQLLAVRRLLRELSAGRVQVRELVRLPQLGPPVPAGLERVRLQAEPVPALREVRHVHLGHDCEPAQDELRVPRRLQVLQLRPLCECATNYFNLNSVCTACPAGTTSAVGASTCECGATKYFDIQNLICKCAANYYPSSSLCLPCPTGSSRTISQVSCQCSYPFSLFSNQCSCGPQAYLYNQQCVSCPAGLTSTASGCACPDPHARFDITSNQCVCVSNYALINSICTRCPDNAPSNGNTCDCSFGGHSIAGFNNTNCHCAEHNYDFTFDKACMIPSTQQFKANLLTFTASGVSALVFGFFLSFVVSFLIVKKKQKQQIRVLNSNQSIGKFLEQVGKLQNATVSSDIETIKW
ncbi:Conserved_hypothetical protein [Hexamita inflata]|uniref:Uncharacterized protein n=1 Tax=Hexamita inflata TaxID=28002 RepID=A0AA86RBD3_9EUKA|nr:Conserved hypothetical protein [Hexamita inflata]